VNLYVPAQLSWRQHGHDVRLSIDTRYPHASAISMTVQTSSPQTFAVNLRIPAWATGASLRINGRHEAVPLIPGTFAALRRQWRPGDRIELDLPLRMRLQPVDAEHPDTVALLAGPLVLMRLGDATTPAPLSNRELLSAQPIHGSASSWHAGAGGAAVTLRPFFHIGGEGYSTYQQVVAA
jgi:DUF1680 family protein